MGHYYSEMGSDDDNEVRQRERLKRIDTIQLLIERIGTAEVLALVLEHIYEYPRTLDHHLETKLKQAREANRRGT